MPSEKPLITLFLFARRFGKSLLVSTLKEIFLGNKELFKGLWIEDKIEWINHPVIHIDFSVVEYETVELMKESLLVYLLGDMSPKYEGKISVMVDDLKAYLKPERKMSHGLTRTTHG